jgi:glycosyltransferase involved in cell wall biosynthesis
MEYPLITIALPVYNVEKYVEQSLCSALDQSYPNLEVLVVDDRGQDKSMDIVHNVAEWHPLGGGSAGIRASEELRAW